MHSHKKCGRYDPGGTGYPNPSKTKAPKNNYNSYLVEYELNAVVVAFFGANLHFPSAGIYL